MQGALSFIEELSRDAEAELSILVNRLSDSVPATAAGSGDKDDGQQAATPDGGGVGFVPFELCGGGGVYDIDDDDEFQARGEGRVITYGGASGHLSTPQKVLTVT